MKITKQDLKEAANTGLLKKTQIQPLWDFFAKKSRSHLTFDLMHLLYYLGAGLIIFGLLGIIAYLTYLATIVFKEALAFPIILSVVGLLVIFIGIYYQKKKTDIDQFVRRRLPNFLLALSPLKRIK